MGRNAGARAPRFVNPQPERFCISVFKQANAGAGADLRQQFDFIPTGFQHGGNRNALG